MTELRLQSGEREIIDRVSEVLDGSIEGIPLSTLNTTAAVAFGIKVGLDAITQVLRGGSGPLGPERNR